MLVGLGDQHMTMDLHLELLLRNSSALLGSDSPHRLAPD